MIRLADRVAINPVVIDQKLLQDDLNELKTILFKSIGIIGIQLMGEPYSMVRILKKEGIGYRLYHLKDDIYVVFCMDYTKKKFDRFYNHIKNGLKIQYDGAVSIYQFYSMDDPEPEYLISMVLKLIQANRDILKTNEEQQKVIQEIEEGNYLMYLQPKADAITGKITGAEALVRYRSNNGSIFPPGRFISRLENKGLIYFVDMFIFEETCRMLERWKQEGQELYPISLNFSRMTLMHEDLLAAMNKIQANYDVARELIEIEITESIDMMDKDTLREIGETIEENGYRLSLDDFGVCFSNLSILYIVRFDTLKIDRSIVQDIGMNERLRVIIKGLIDTCHKLNICVIAEGVETKKQRKELNALGCDCIQGYLIGRPIDKDIFEKVHLQKGKDSVMNDV